MADYIKKINEFMEVNVKSDMNEWACAFKFRAEKDFINGIKNKVAKTFSELLNIVENNKNGSAHNTLQVLEVFPYDTADIQKEYKLGMSIDFKDNWVYFESRGEKTQKSGARLDMPINAKDPKVAAKNRVIIFTNLLKCIKGKEGSFSNIKYVQDNCK